MYLLPLVSIVLFLVIMYIYLKVVFNNNSELSKKLLKLLTSTLILSLLLVLRIFALSEYEHKFLLDATYTSVVAAHYFSILFSYSYNCIDMHIIKKRVLKIGTLLVGLLVITNRYHEFVYSYAFTEHGGIFRAVAVPKYLQIILLTMMVLVGLIHILVVYRKVEIHGNLKSYIYLVTFLTCNIVYGICLFYYNPLQVDYNLIYIVVVLQSVVFYLVASKFELNLTINKVKTKFVESIDSPILVVVDDGKIVKYNKIAGEVFTSLDEKEHSNIYDMKEIFISDRSRFNLFETKILQINTNDGEEKFYKVSVNQVNVSLINKYNLIILEDITAFRNLEQDLTKLTTIDQLTGLFNRQHFKTLGEELLNEHVRSDKTLAVFMLDLDRFKSINDTYGHLVGDEFLIAISKVMEEKLNAKGYIARYGGEEFCGIIQAESNEMVRKILDDLRYSISITKVNVSKFEKKSVTVSIGYYISENLDDDLDSMFRLADISLYKAKRNGRNRVEKYQSN